ncbi:MAG: PqqD family protein [Acidobacteriota bacterium]
MTEGDFPVRAPHLEIEEAGDGFIVYDESRDRVHYLNHTAALVVELAIGDLESQGIANWIAQVYALEKPPIEDVVQLIDELRKENLLLPATEG